MMPKGLHWLTYTLVFALPHLAIPFLQSCVVFIES